MNNRKKNKTGFSLIEMILYIAIVMIFLTGAVLFGWTAIYSRIKSQVHIDVNYNLNLITKRMSYEIKNAKGINSLATDDLCLEVANEIYNPTRFYLSGDVFMIAWGGGSSDCTLMNNDQPLSSDTVNVSDLTFTDLSDGTGKSKNIKFDITVDSNNSGNRQEWDKTQSYSSSIELRSN